MIDKEEDSEVVIVKVASKRADEYVIKERDPSENRYSNLTAYDFNSRYEYVQRGDTVVRAVHVESLPTDPHGLTQEGRTLLAQNADVKTYAFPISRLRPVGE